ncbi:MAG TPA: hypothetical protein VH369_02145 [Bryobacteraceae bacterium]|jgi:hypothetical protein
MKAGLALLALSVTAVAQTPAPQKPVAAVASGAVGSLLIGGFSNKAEVGHPYSAEQVTERVQTLADGTHITQNAQTTKFYRDSEGRTRTEHIFTPPPGAVMVSMPSLIQITDPVAGYRYTLDSRTQTAHRTAFLSPARVVTAQTAPANLPRPNVVPATTAASKGDSTRPRPEVSRESLGTQTIEGVLAEGTRTTTIFPVDFMGNDRPITTVSETWISPDLKTVMLSKTSDPRFGDTTTKLTNIIVADPDPALFQVPAEYSIVDESAPGIR